MAAALARVALSTRSQLGPGTLHRIFDSESLRWFLLYFLVALSVGTFVRDVPAQPDIFTNVSDYTRPPGLRQSDAVSFLEGARDLYDHKQFTPPHYWLIHLWPPGFMALEATVLGIFGLASPFLFVLVAINAACLAALFLLMRGYLLELLPWSGVSLVPMVTLVFPIVRSFLLEPAAAAFGEGIAIVFFLMVLLLVFAAVRRRSRADAVSAGLVLALAAYFRSQFESITLFLSLTAILVAVLMLVRRYLRQSHDFRALRAIALALIVAHAAMLPWRIHNFNSDSRSFTWQQATLLYRNASLTDAALYAIGGAWIVEGGGNLACELETTYCGKPDEAAFYGAFRNHIGQWYARKAAIVGRYWFASLGNSFRAVADPSAPNIAANAFYVLCVLMTLPLLWYSRRRADAALILSWYCSAFYAFYFVALTFIHYETRYFYTIKIVAVFTFLLLSFTAVARRGEVRASPYIDREVRMANGI